MYSVLEVVLLNDTLIILVHNNNNNNNNNKGALGAAGVRDGLQLGRSVRRTAGGGILFRHAHRLLSFGIDSVPV